jgi:hypothetical protein
MTTTITITPVTITPVMITKATATPATIMRGMATTTARLTRRAS